MKNLLNKIQKTKKATIWMLIVLNVVLSGGYAYAVKSTVFNVVASTKAEKALVQNLARVTDLESSQAVSKNKITLDFAYAQGFQDASNQQIFIVKKPVVDTLSFNAL